MLLSASQAAEARATKNKDVFLLGARDFELERTSRAQGDEITLQELGHATILLRTEKRRVKWLGLRSLLVALCETTAPQTSAGQPSRRVARARAPCGRTLLPPWRRRRGGAVVREQPAGAPLPLVHRRLEAGGGGVAAASSGGSGDSAARSLQGASAAGGAPTAAAPPALLPLGTLPTSTAALIFGLLSKGDSDIVMPLPAALSSGGGSGGAVASGTATYIPTAQGCGADLLTAPLGLTADLTMVLAADQVPVRGAF